MAMPRRRRAAELFAGGVTAGDRGDLAEETDA
jgi:hypothetical protein